MKVSREQVALNRQKILEEAGRLFRARGFEAVTVAEVMKAAGLTHGGFYGHFASKDDLIAQTLTHALLASAPGEIDLPSFTEAYLSPDHCADLAGGCATAGLGAETIRQSPEARAAMTAGLRRQVERFSRSAPGATEEEKRQAGIGSWAAMVGAVILARLSDDPKLSGEILEQTRAWIVRDAARVDAG
ncbi:TetR/AcrR family transcriptional regulator [Bosea caraganae]|uniref:TetR/AcrR family transcriptional regulator n=1 Tax=Bosea caraganae TaxID=2763117 RepID=A0A370LD41_9HYPH|nr:helix-turn-helix domain-containing protein [Bosea caraganae]RDJ27880.1 TetR/AcrR family transcriptional regulator [Bosea caraganae]RDJ29892.1 TetR/AcrR family transcriptional regulator [Bosea caraganae]